MPKHIVAGTGHEGRAKFIRLMSKKTPVRLIREPKNEHDLNAIAVEANITIPIPLTFGLIKWWLQIGYLKQSAAKRYAPKMDAGKRPVVKVDSMWAPQKEEWPRVTLSIEFNDR